VEVRHLVRVTGRVAPPRHKAYAPAVGNLGGARKCARLLRPRVGIRCGPVAIHVAVLPHLGARELEGVRQGLGLVGWRLRRRGSGLDLCPLKRSPGNGDARPARCRSLDRRLGLGVEGSGRCAYGGLRGSRVGIEIRGRGRPRALRDAFYHISLRRRRAGKRGQRCTRVDPDLVGRRRRRPFAHALVGPGLVLGNHVGSLGEARAARG